jgi:hypothetical protein
VKSGNLNQEPTVFSSLLPHHKSSFKSILLRTEQNMKISNYSKARIKQNYRGITGLKNDTFLQFEGRKDNQTRIDSTMET